MKDAREFAIKAHGDQRYGDHPYVFHLDAVHAVLLEFIEPFAYKDLSLFAAAYLHDVLEETAVTEDELANHFGPFVAALVKAVTNQSGVNRTERWLKTCLAIKPLKQARILKLADRIANVRQSKATSPGLFQMYMCEYSAFKSGILSMHGCAKEYAMWAELDRLFADAVLPQ